MIELVSINVFKFKQSERVKHIYFWQYLYYNNTTQNLSKWPKLRLNGSNYEKWIAERFLILYSQQPRA